MKIRLVTVLLASALAIGLAVAACGGSAPAAPAGEASGTATGEAPGYQGRMVSVTITMEAGKIVEVEMDVSTQTDGFGDQVPPVAREEMIRRNSATFDAVAGVTFTSEAVMAAAQSAIDQINAAWAAAAGSAPAEELSEDEDEDEGGDE